MDAIDKSIKLKKYFYTAKLPLNSLGGPYSTYGYVYAKNKKEAFYDLTGVMKKKGIYRIRRYDVKLKTQAEIDKKEARKMGVNVKNYRDYMKSFEE